MRQGRALLWGLTLTSCLVAWLIGEVALRAAGYRWTIRIPVDEPTIHVPDPVLGWRNAPGRYTFSAYTPGGRPSTVTFLPDGTRATGPEPARGPVRVWVVGDSYTEGWAISDHETYAWKLQAALPRASVRNLGSAGYSTYQSLLDLERRLDAGEAPPQLVLYGFVGHHELRNVADPFWLSLLARVTKRGQVAVPFCLLGTDGGLACRPPAAYPCASLDRLSSVVYVARNAYYSWRRPARLRQARAVTQRLMLRMADSCRRHGANLVVVPLDLWHEDSVGYCQRLSAAGVASIDCARRDLLDRPEFQVPGEGHPNELMNGYWAECIASALRRDPALQ